MSLVILVNDCCRWWLMDSPTLFLSFEFDERHGLNTANRYRCLFRLFFDITFQLVPIMGTLPVCGEAVA